MARKSGSLVIAVIGGVTIALTGFVVQQVTRAMKRITLSNADKLHEYKELLGKTLERLLDDTLSNIDRKRLEKLKKHCEKEIKKYEEKEG